MLQKCQNINFWKLVRAGFHAILTCGPVLTSFQVDIEIYEDKLGQSGDRILSSHITKNVIIKLFLQFVHSNKDKLANKTKQNRCENS